MNHEKEEKILFKEECYQIQGAIFEVYKEIGPGFLESVYQECLEKELTWKNIPSQKWVCLLIFNAYPKAEIERIVL